MKAFFSCGAGDFIAIESFLEDSVKRQIREFYLFTRSAPFIIDLIRLHPYWQSCKIHVPYTDAQIKAFGVYAFYDIKHLRRTTGKEHSELNDATDFSGEALYPAILAGHEKYKESLFKIYPLPVDVVIDRASNADDRMVKKGRNLTDTELEIIMDRKKGKTFAFPSPETTTMIDALGLVSGCTEFYGVDSMLSVFAARQDNIKKIQVKTINPIYKKWKAIYDPNNKIEVLDGFK